MTYRKESDSKMLNPSCSANVENNGKKSSTPSEKLAGEGGIISHPVAMIGQKLHVRLGKDEVAEFVGLLHDLGFSDPSAQRAQAHLVNARCVAIYFTAEN